VHENNGVLKWRFQAAGGCFGRQRLLGETTDEEGIRIGKRTPSSSASNHVTREAVFARDSSRAASQPARGKEAATALTLR
jgi:hypothetical protein